MKKIFLFLFLLASMSEATTRYVSPTGSGSTCSSAVPCSVSTGWTATVAGDTLIFKAGTYNYTGTTFLVINKSGSVGNYITIKSETPYAAILNGQSTADNAFKIYQPGTPISYIKIQDFEIKNFRSWAVTAGSSVTSETTANVSYVEFSGNYVHDIARYQVACNTTEQYGRGGVYGSIHTSNWTITRNTFTNIGRLQGGCTTGNADWAHDHPVYTGHSGATSSVYTTYWDITNNLWYEGDTCQGGFFVAIGQYGRYINIINNTAVGSNCRAATEGIVFLNSNTTATNLQNNIFYGTYNGFIDNEFADSCSSCTTYNNLTNAAAVLGYGTATPITNSGNLLSRNPLFNNAAGDDYSLTINSPARDAGRSTGSPSVDIDGQGRPINSLYDIGAYEYPKSGVIDCSNDTTPPTTPTGLTATATGSDSISLSWSASTDNCSVVRYDVYRCEGASCTVMTNVASTVSSTSWSDSRLTCATTYRYKVIAFDTSGNYSSYSSIASATTDACPTEATYNIDKPTGALDFSQQNCNDFTAAGADGFAIETTAGVTTIHATMSLLADENALYICVTVNDTDIRSTLSSGVNLSTEDSIEFLFDPDGAGSVPAYKWVFAPNGAVTYYEENVITATPRMRKKAYYTGTLNDTTADTSWMIKAKIGWLDWGVTKPNTSTEWSFDVALNKKQIDTLSSLAYSNSDGGSFENVSGFATGTFTNIPVRIRLRRP